MHVLFAVLIKQDRSVEISAPTGRKASDLGLDFTATRGVAGGMLEMQRRQNAAAGLLRRRIKRLDCHYSVDVMMQLYLTTVAPTASYGCEVWGLRHMVAECRTGRNKLEASSVQAMRELCGVRRSVPAAVLLQCSCRSLASSHWRWNGSGRRCAFGVR